MKQPETEIYKALSKYMRLKHPNVVFRFDFAAGTKMTVGQATRHKSINPHRGYPDLFIAEPRGGYCGMFLEIKAMGSSPYKKNGGLVSNIHIQEQYLRLLELATKGYRSYFAVGIDECIDKIEAYLGG